VTGQARVAVVSGAASGIGLAVAQHLVEQGHRVALLDRQGDAVRQAASDLEAAGGRAMAAEIDVTDRDGLQEAFRLVRAELGPVQIVVTSAGIEAFQPVTEVTGPQWDRMISINLTGTFNTIQPLIPDMVDAGWGRIVTISSMSAQAGAPDMAPYVASKGGVIALTKALSYELAPKGITANTIPPSIVDTPMAREAEAAGKFPGVQAIAAVTPVRRAGTADDIAAACTFLCSEQASFITGQIIGVNGGWYM
jgi:2-hydroxycyclohexanecarboxyl-CoA dehydrogenase